MNTLVNSRKTLLRIALSALLFLKKGGHMAGKIKGINIEIGGDTIEA